MAVAGAEREDMTCMVLVSAPVPEVMCRRTPENEDDPVWQTSAALRLADTLSAIAPLEMITQGRRPVLLVHGAVDDELPVTHLEAWRSALAFTGKPVETIEIAFADALFQPIDADGHVDAEDPWALDLLADVISRWTGRILAGR